MVISAWPLRPNACTERRTAMTNRERQGWWIAASLFLALFLLWGSGFNTAGLFIAPLIKQFGWARTQVSLLVAAIAFASGITSPIAGRLLERVEVKLLPAFEDPALLRCLPSPPRSPYKEPVCTFFEPTTMESENCYLGLAIQETGCHRLNIQASNRNFC